MKSDVRNSAVIEILMLRFFPAHRLFNNTTGVFSNTKASVIIKMMKKLLNLFNNILQTCLSKGINCIALSV